ncbi:TPA: hypothetical protein ACX3EK_001962 [Vibrio parahaemolyticus]|uniref:hypothetical protein n=1 Tax=Vibrio parahaemolyticus TaxID=670 RepID=UPI001B8181AD|nr:hypothetical protein [Vibrio parahaemolyticus]MDF4693363.1 hypothetical protein [Vibrio parahaemolyticus]MDF4721814.1 hypothetical protein [Vibrio parahaemolyticus]MDF4761780.1 hypothetical protein [Vibrio parahaemolyticus]MDF5372863.1 hypothetical protein [Vibrio parahaemolyticus]MDF5614683.1 hypothetical protein [Vibrio parahaemolyticus]
MRRTLMTLLGIILLTGCAERYFSGSGVEALIYPETHVYQLTIKSVSESAEQLGDIIDKVSEIDSGGHYLLEYRNSKGKKVVQHTLKTRATLPLRADSLELKPNSTIDSDLLLTVTYHAMMTQACKPAEIERANPSRNCFSEVARMKQVSHKERIVEGL